MSVFRGDERMRSDGESGLARDVGVGPRVGLSAENLLTLATGLDRQRAGRSGDMFGGLVTTTTRTRRGGGRAGGRAGACIVVAECDFHVLDALFASLAGRVGYSRLNTPRHTPTSASTSAVSHQRMQRAAAM